MQILNQTLNSSRSGQSRIYHLCLWQRLYMFLWSIYDWPFFQGHHQINCTLEQLHCLVWQLVCSLITLPVFRGGEKHLISLLIFLPEELHILGNCALVEIVCLSPKTDILVLCQNSIPQSSLRCKATEYFEERRWKIDNLVSPFLLHLCIKHITSGQNNVFWTEVLRFKEKKVGLLEI